MNVPKLLATLSVAALVVAAGMGTPSARGQYGRQYGDRTAADRLTGTYELDRTRSDDPARAADRALRQLPNVDRDRVLRRITTRLEPPEVLAIERSGAYVRMASSRAPEMSFTADGRSRSELGPNGRNVSTRASFVNDRLEVSTRGAAGSDFSVTFEPYDANDSLRVTRRLFDERLRQPVVVQSIYRKVSDTADWDVYTGTRAYNPYDESRYGPSRYESSVVVPADVTLVATLDQTINMRSARNNDVVTLTVVEAPRADLDGAVIEGAIAPSGSNALTMTLDRLRLRDGRTANFSGVIESVRGPNGEPIPYNGEQVRTGGDQREQAIQRGAIGAALGALVGAIAGGGKGAAVGAVVGGGGGVATVFVDQLNRQTLDRGTEFTIRTRT